MKLFAVLVLGAMLALGQTLVGLPEYGVTLSGTPADPTIENHSSQTIIGLVLRLFYGDGPIPVNAASFKARDIWLGRTKGLEPHQTEPFGFLQHPVKMQINGRFLTGTPTQIVLDSVVLANGQMVGPDVANTFPNLLIRVAALKDLASRAVPGEF
jgi:hypothetical protein